MLNRAEFLKPIAHRGLHDVKKGLVENSSGAFIAAIKKGYGIECDLRPIREGIPVVFHDKSLSRLAGTEELLCDLSKSDLKKVRYKYGGEHILTYNDFLSLVSGHVPILAEVKSDWNLPDIKFLSKIARLSLEYKGPLAFMSFDPDIITILRELAVEIPRGIIAGSEHHLEGEITDEEELDQRSNFNLNRVMETHCNDLSFCAYQVHGLPNNLTVRFLREVKHLPIFAWTVRTREELEISKTLADAPIFECIEP